jgi:hypothetical protein
MQKSSFEPTVARLRSALIGLLTLALPAIVTGCGNSEPPPVAMAAKSEITEADFQDSVNSDTLSADLVKEWRAARADHRLVVATILACTNTIGELQSMPPRRFAELLLDLTPQGSHTLRISQPQPSSTTAAKPTPGAPTAAQVVSNPAAPEREVLANLDSASKASPPDDATNQNASATTPTAPGTPGPKVVSATASSYTLQWDLLGLSDAIARARLLAVGGKLNSITPANRLWLVTLLVGGFATLFVTLQAKMVRPPDEPPKVRPPTVAAKASVTEVKDGGVNQADPKQPKAEAEAVFLKALQRPRLPRCHGQDNGTVGNGACGASSSLPSLRLRCR